MKVLITGGAGFIGSSVADQLLKTHNEVVVIDNFNNYYDPKIKEQNIKNNLEHPYYHLYRCDIEDMSKLSRIFEEKTPDIVVHLAARAGVRPSLENPVEYVQSNILGTVNILECMRKFNVKKLVFASSSSVYGNNREELFSETLKVTEPISPYAATKSACEQICYTWHHLYNISVVALRFFTVYGPRQRPDLAISKFVKLINEGKPIPVFGDGTTKRDYTYIDDIVSGIISSINYNETSYEIINLGGGEPITLNRMIQTIEKTLNKKAYIQRLPMQLGDVNKTVCDYSKAQRLLDYNPKTSFEEGITKFVQWVNDK